MADYVLPHAIPQEDERLSLMSRMLDPQMFFRLEQLGVGEGWRCLEVGAGNGSVSRWLAERVGPAGRVVTSDIDTRFLDRLSLPNLEVRRIDVTRDPLGDGYDLVCGRGVAAPRPASGSTCSGGSRPRSGRAASSSWRSPTSIRCWRRTARSCATSGRASWRGPPTKASTTSSAAGWRRCSRASGCGRSAAHGETILFDGGSLPARYLSLTMKELEASLTGSGLIGPTVWAEAMALFDTPQFWTWQNCYVTTTGRKPA